MPLAIEAFEKVVNYPSTAQPPNSGQGDSASTDLLDVSGLTTDVPTLTFSVPSISKAAAPHPNQSEIPGLARSMSSTASSPAAAGQPSTSTTTPIPILSPIPKSQLQNIRPHRSIIDEFDPFGQGSEPGSPGTLASFGSAPGGHGRRSRSHSRAGSSRGPDAAGESGSDDEVLVKGLETMAVEAKQDDDKEVDGETPKSAKVSGKNKELTENEVDLTEQAKTPDRKQTSSRRSGEGQGSSSRRKDVANAGPQFDFQGFLSQLRLKSADSIQKYLKSFLVSFSRRNFTINEQIKLIHDFLAFISSKMKQVEPWKSQSPAEFDNATEAMEKLVMNRLYTFTFSPQIDSVERPLMTDDLERDAVLSQRIRLFGWIREKHLDVPEGESSQGFLAFAEQELLKVNHYKAPRDKMICILNACKVIFGLIRNDSASGKSASADDFLPILIFVVLRANPENLISNVEYITRFRGNGKLDGEPGYYLSSLSGAISFIETLEASGLSNITPEKFEENVERSLAELPPGTLTHMPPGRSHTANSDNEGEEPARALTALQPTIALDNTKRFFQRTGELATGAVSRPLSALGKMLLEGVNPVTGSAPGSEDGESGDERLFTEKDQYRTPPKNSQSQANQPSHLRYPQPRSGTRSSSLLDPGSSSPTTASGSPSRTGFLTNNPIGGWLPRRSSPSASPAGQSDYAPQGDQGEHMMGRSQVDEMLVRSQVDCQPADSSAHNPSEPPPSPSPVNYNTLTAEIDRTHATAHQAGTQTLHQMFPGLPEEVCAVVLEGCGGDLGVAIDRMLEMTAGD